MKSPRARSGPETALYEILIEGRREDGLGCFQTYWVESDRLGQGIERARRAAKSKGIRTPVACRATGIDDTPDEADEVEPGVFCERGMRRFSFFLTSTQQPVWRKASQFHSCACLRIDKTDPLGPPTVDCCPPCVYPASFRSSKRHQWKHDTTSRHTRPPCTRHRK